MTGTLVAVALALAAASPAGAAIKYWPVGGDQVHVIARGVDPSAPSGRAALLVATERAAAMLCRDVQPAAEERGCIADTVHRTAAAPSNQALALAIIERDQRQVASR